MLKNKNKNIQLHLLVLAVGLLLGACTPYKKIPQDQYLYTGATFEIKNESKQNIGTLNEEIEEIIRPLPNTLLFGSPYKVGFYYLLGEPKSEKGLKSWFRKRFGEKPVIANEQIIERNIKNIEGLLNNKGYFGSVVTGKLKIEKKKAKAIYEITLTKQWMIEAVSFEESPNAEFQKSFLIAQNNSLLKTNNPYDFGKILEERIRIDRVLKNQGYYYFRPDFVSVEADTLKEKYKVSLKVFLNKKFGEFSQNKFRIDEVVIFPNYTITSDNSIVNPSISAGSRLTIVDSTKRYNPRILARAIGFRRNSFYNADIHDVSLQRLISLNNFKLVRNEFLKTSDTTLKAFYFLTPYKANALKLELNGVTKSNSYSGLSLDLNYTNRNLFRGAEILKIALQGGIDGQVGGRSQITNFYGVTNLKIIGGLSLPKLYLPLAQSKINNQTLPKTNIGLSYEIRKVESLYDQTSLNFTFGYSFRQKNGIEHQFNPVSINFVKAKNVSELFVEEIFKNPLLLKILENQLIIGGNYNFTYSPTQIGKSQYYFNGGIDIAGNLASAIAKKDEDGNKMLLGEYFAQYVRFDSDFRYYYDINKSMRWANRVITGFGIPYGTSLQLPYFKQFFAGGNNSIRAFRARSIGPGGYERTGSVIEQFLGNQSADVKLELNSEIRYKLSNFLNFAAFVDAGNIWMYKDEYIYGESSLFTKNFYKQLAVGGGLGLRLDFGFFLMRFDVATPFRKPWVTDNNGWVFRDISLFKRDWRKDNLLLNIAINHPF